MLPISSHVPAYLLQKYKKVRKYANKTDNFCHIMPFLYLCTAFLTCSAPIIMAKIFKTIAPVDSMSGMIGSRKTNLSGKAIIANIRKRGGNWNEGNPFQYFSVLTRTTASAHPSEAVLEHRAKFASVVRAVYERMYDPNKMPIDQQNFKNQTKYKTLYSYIWNLEWDSYTPA